MTAKEVELTLTLPINSWRWLVAMAAEDLREPGDFLHWLAFQEAKRRGLLHTEPQPGTAQPQPASAA